MGAIVMPRQSVEARPGLVWAQYRSSEGGVNNGWVYVVVVKWMDKGQKQKTSSLRARRSVRRYHCFSGIPPAGTVFHGNRL